jgi:hypothetical protein
MEELAEQVAKNIRRIAAEKFPYRQFHSGPKAHLRRALGIVDRRTFDTRWDGERPWDINELVIIAEALGVRVADFVQPIDEDTEGE